MKILTMANCRKGSSYTDTCDLKLLEWHIHLWITRNYYISGTLGRALEDPQQREDQKQKSQRDATGTHVV